MIDFIQQFTADLYSAFSTPEKRVFIGYLASATGIAVLWLMFFQHQTFKQSIATFFSKNVWCSRSAKSDYLIFFINRIFMAVVSPRLLSQLALATALFFWLHEASGGRPLLLANAPDWVIGLLFTACFFVVDDFSRYLVHRQLHRWPLLWAFHKVHHSAETLTPITVFRTHPVEAIIFSLRSIIVQATMIASFVFFLGERADFITVLGANFFIFVFNALGSNLRHSHIPIHYWKPLEKVLLSPAQHQIHHSIEEKHWDKNFGVVLAIWDKWGNSLHHIEKKELLTFGLNKQSTMELHSLRQIYIAPCKEATGIIIRYTKKQAKLMSQHAKTIKNFATPTHVSKT